MSSDLFAAFGDSSQQPSYGKPNAPAEQSTKRFSFFDDLNASSNSFTGAQPQQNTQWTQSDFPSNFSNNAAEQDDDFGDFEDASPSVEPPRPDPLSMSSGIWAPQASNPSFHQHQLGISKIAVASPTSIPVPFASSLLDLDEAFTQPVPKQSQQSIGNSAQPISGPSLAFTETPQTSNFVGYQNQGKLDRIAPDQDVLFDASAYSDDDFGDFEGSQTHDHAKIPPKVAAQSNTSIADTRNHAPVKSFQPQRPNASVQRHVFPTSSTTSNADLLGELEELEEKSSKPARSAAASSKPKSTKSTTKTPKPIAVTDDSWGEFDDWDPSAPAAGPAIQSDSATTEGILSSIRPASIPELSSNDLPPTNIPPPAVVLSLFPPIFADAQVKLFKPLAAQPYQLKNRILSDSITIDFLRGYTLLATVAAHVIAGRKYRWKRDKHLSQGMRIGPASSRATSGMKLAGIDKGEDAREDREVLDVVRAWKEQLGRLRSTLTGVNSVASAGFGSALEIQQFMPVRVARESEGGVQAPQPCALCGLKRDERISKVNGDVQDSFGEWWIDQMSMHRACRNFWEEHKETLRQR